MTFESYKRKINHLEEGMKRCTKSTNGSSLRKSAVTNKTESEPLSRNTCTGNNIPIIMSEHILLDPLESPIREIVPHAIDNGTPRDMPREDDNNTNR